MANTLGQMKTEVRQWFDVTTARLDDVPLERIINDVCKDLYRRGDYLFLQDEDTSITTVAGTAAYTLPSGVGRVTGVYMTRSGSNYWCKYMSPEDYASAQYENLSNGETSYFTLFGTKIKFGPIPDGAYQVTIMNFQFPEDMEDDTDTNSFLTYAWDVVLFGTLAETAKYLMESDRIMEFSTEYEKRFRRFLIDQTRALTGSNRPTSVETRSEF